MLIIARDSRTVQPIVFAVAAVLLPPLPDDDGRRSDRE
jgi:hypothetical protein